MAIQNLKKYITWRAVMLSLGATAAAVISMIQVWSLTVTPYLNSGYAPIVGRKEFAQLVTQQEQTAKILEQVTKGLQSQTEALAKTVDRLDSRDCEDWNRRLMSAEKALRKDYNDRLAKELRDAALEKIRTIPNCMREPD